LAALAREDRSSAEIKQNRYRFIMSPSKSRGGYYFKPVGTFCPPVLLAYFW